MRQKLPNVRAIIGTYIAGLPVAYLVFLTTAPSNEELGVFLGTAVVDLILGVVVGLAAMAWSGISYAMGRTPAYSEGSMRYGIDMIILSMGLLLGLGWLTGA